VFDSPGTKVLNNSIVIAGGSYPNAIEYRFPDATGVLIANNLTNKAIAAREGATATVTNNITSATADMFADAAAGDLHLVAAATAAIDHGVAQPDVVDDWDGSPRDGVPDIGADEFAPAAIHRPPAPPKNLRIIPPR
jgi:hypothetical protein